MDGHHGVLSGGAASVRRVRSRASTPEETPLPHSRAAFPVIKVMSMKRIESIRLHQSVRWLPADMDTPISLFLGMVRDGYGILLESAEVDGRWGRYSVLACDMALFLSCREGCLSLRIEDSRLEPLAALEGMPFVAGLRAVMEALSVEPDPGAAELPPITRSLCGWFGFGMAGLFEPGLAAALPPEDAECTLCLPGTLMLFDHLYNRLAQVSLGAHRPVTAAHAALYEGEADCAIDEADVAFSPDEAGFKAMVENIRQMLGRGEAMQAVPSVRFSAPFSGEALTLYRRMRSLEPSPYMFFMRLPGITLFGSSPEVMVQCTGGRLLTAPTAGTRPRGCSSAEDEALTAELLADERERAGHMLLVDLGRSDIGRLSRPGTVEVQKLMAAERFAHVTLLTSRITGELKEGLDAVDVLSSSFPAGTVCGVPRIRAAEVTAALEPQARGPYAGCIGWLGLDRDAVHLDTGITMRSMWVREGRLYWQAGARILHDADPGQEWEKAVTRAEIMRRLCSASGGGYVPAHR